MANNPNAKDNLAPPWRPGESANPGGKTSEQKRRELRNAEMATEIAEAALLAVKDRIVDGKLALDDLKGEVLKLIKDAQDRGLGAPKTTNDTTIHVDHSSSVADFKGKLARIAKRSRPDETAH